MGEVLKTFGDRLDVMEIKCLRSICGTTKTDEVKNEEVRRRGDVREKISDRVNRKGFEYF